MQMESPHQLRCCELADGVENQLKSIQQVLRRQVLMKAGQTPKLGLPAHESHKQVRAMLYCQA